MVGRTGEPYAYAYDSPVNEKDPSGLKACEANEPGGKRCPYIRFTPPQKNQDRVLPYILFTSWS